MKKLITFILLSLAVLSAQNELNRETLFIRGVSSYAAGKYQESIRIFNELDASGTSSYSLYYNLGNSYYKVGELGRAIQYWEKAAIINPGNKDLRFNLQLARSRIEDQVVLPKIFFLFEWYKQLENKLNIPLMIMTAGIFFSLSVLSLILKKLNFGKRKTPYRFYMIFFLVLFLSVLLVTMDLSSKRDSYTEGIVIDDTLDIMNEPLENSPVSFILHEGAKIVIEEKIEDDWLKISYYDDKTGWVKTKFIGEI